MKIHLKFNHEAETVLESIDCPFTSDQVTDQVNDCVKKFMENDDLDTKSHLAQIMDRDLDYSVILFLALRQVTEDIEKQAIKGMLKRMLIDEDDETI